jgi:hypothetical protein
VSAAVPVNEADLLAHIQLMCSRGDTRLFRFNAGIAWAGKIIERTPRKLVLLDYHPVKLGPAGMADLFGWSSGGLVTAIEGKVGRRQPTDEQAAFLELVRAHGGRAGIARTVEDAVRIINGVAAL